MINVFSGFQNTLTDLIAEGGKSLEEISRDLGTAPNVLLRWCNRPQDVALKTLIKLSDYYKCSIEYLCGKTYVFCDYTPKLCPPFGEWLPKILKQYGLSSYRLFKDTTVKPSQYHYWRKGAEPRLFALETIAEKLNITLDCLVGRDRL